MKTAPACHVCVEGSASVTAGLVFATCDGQLATAEHAGMIRVRMNGKTVPAGYATLWESVRWAIHNGAQAFDLGGVSVPGDRSYDATRSIANFKSNFGGELRAGLEHEFERRTNTVSARLMNSLEGLVNRFR
jgi:lipid II:glycine glycyltransferase (peptidoglycan interpeptide bridge formation enzyme)